MTFTTSTLARLASLTTLLFAFACSGTDPAPTSGSTVGNAVGAGQKKCDEADESEDGPNDKVVCSVDADCDADEVCSNGRCTGLDGEDEDDACEGDEGPDGADDDGDDETDDGAGDPDDEEEPGDKIVCSTNADCDSDEVCTNGLCR